MLNIYREKYYLCGDYMEVHLYPVHRKAGVRRKKSKPSSECQKKLNEMIAENKFIRKLNYNFTSEDYKIELTYRNEYHPQSDDEASRNLSNFLRRMKRLRTKLGLPPLKYASVTEKGAKKGRYHHHLVISGGISPKDIAQLWGMGRIGAEPLQFDENGVADLARYMLKKSEASKKKWNASKNLAAPPEKQRDGRLSKRKVMELAKDTDDHRAFEKYYDGYYLSEAKRVYNDVNGGIYIYARFYRKDAEFCTIREKTKRYRQGYPQKTASR